MFRTNLKIMKSAIHSILASVWLLRNPRRMRCSSLFRSGLYCSALSCADRNIACICIQVVSHIPQSTKSRLHNAGHRTCFVESIARQTGQSKAFHNRMHSSVFCSKRTRSQHGDCCSRKLTTNVSRPHSSWVLCVFYLTLLGVQGPVSNPSLVKDSNQQDPKAAQQQPCSKW